jgi:branched-chain amino acid transport system substrate-binding protein
MRKALLLVLAAGLLWFLLAPQWQSYERMGERRFHALSRPGNPLLVGVVWPFEANQDGMSDGLELAKEEINAAGLPLRLVQRDPGFDWEKNRRIAMEFANTPEMSAVVGFYEDSAAIKASAIYEPARLLQLLACANSTAMTARGFKYVIRTVVSNQNIARSLARMSFERGYKKFALVAEEDAFGEDLAYQYRVSMDSMDTQLLYQTTYPIDRADFRLAVNELKGIDADVIFFAGVEPLAGDFLRMARSVGLKTPVIGAFSDTPEMRKRAGPGLEGAMFFDFYDVNQPTQANEAFVRKFRARFGHDPDAMAAQGYDTLTILAKAAKFTGSRNSLDLSYAIRFMERWEGANGWYQFDPNGEMQDKSIYLNVYNDGIPVTIQASHPPPAQVKP